MLTLHVNLWPGDAPGPPNDIRARHVIGTEMSRFSVCPEKGVERRGGITSQIARTGHPATASR